MEKRMYDFTPPRASRRSAPAARRPRKRRRKKHFFSTACLTACLILALACGAARLSDSLKSAARSGINIVSSMLPVDLGGAWDADTRAAVEQLAGEYPEARAMLETPDNWPADVAALAARNPEALPFVLAYPDIRTNPPASRVEEAAQGVFPALYQWDTRWGCADYGGSIVALSGCGPTALSIVTCGLTGSADWTPAAIAAWSQGNGYAGSFGTSWELMSDGCTRFGIYGEELPLTESAVTQALAEGHPVICAMRPGDFTTSGHFIVLTGVEDGKIRLVDPNSPARTAELWEYSRLEPQIKNLWVYTAG